MKKVATCDLEQIGGRLKVAREALGLSRPAFTTIHGGSVRTLENNEKGANEPGACLVAAFASAGINANWLLTGDGRMFIHAGAPLGRLMTAARGEIPVQQLAEWLETPAINIVAFERGEALPDKQTLRDIAAMCDAHPAPLLRALAKIQGVVDDQPINADAMPSRPAPSVKINIEALATAIVAMQKLSKPGEAPEVTARKAAEFYQYCLDQGLITPDGLGDGNMKEAS